MTAVNGRVRKTFADLALAKKEASNIAPNLAEGDLEALKLTGREKQIYVDASQTVARTGIPLSSVAREHYFDIVESRAAKEYWNIRPLPRGDNQKIVSMR